MNLLRNRIIVLLAMFFLIITFWECAITKKNELPFRVTDLYYQKWIGDIKGLTLGWTVTLSVKSRLSNVSLDSIYFGGMRKQLRFESYKNKTTYVAFFDFNKLEKSDMVMGSSPIAEYGTKTPNLPDKFKMMKLNNSVLVYTEDGETKYFKFTNMRRNQNLIFLGSFPN